MTKDINRVRVYGDVATVTGRGCNTGMFKGEPIGADEWVTYDRDGKPFKTTVSRNKPAPNDAANAGPAHE